MAELRRLARHCEFGSNLNEHLRDRLVCGLNNPATIRKLLAEANLDLKKAIHIAHATETAARNANELHKETPVPTHQLRAQSAKFKGRYQTHGHGSKPCYRCGGTDHRQEDCPTRTPLVTTAARLGTSMQPAARNAQTSLTALHRAVDLHRRNRPLGTRQGLQLEHTISRLRITPKMSFSFIIMSRTRNTRGPRFGLSRPSTEDHSKWSLTLVRRCRSYRSVCTRALRRP